MQYVLSFLKRVFQKGCLQEGLIRQRSAKKGKGHIVDIVGMVVVVVFDTVFSVCTSLTLVGVK